MVKVKDIHFLPLNPGCYLFRNSAGEVIYVGKAKSIRKRVSSYFQKTELEPKTAELVKNIQDIDFFVTPSEVEALILENSLIKKHYPKYNLDLKDSHRYAYILIHNEDIPWLEVVRYRDTQGEYYGPFVSGAMRKLIMEVLTRTFRVYSRKPSQRIKKSTDKEQYLQRIKQARQILKGNVDELITELHEKMKIASAKTFYEYSLSLRNQIAALKTLKEKQIMEMTRNVDANIINYMISGDTVYLLVFSVRKGILEGKQEYSFDYYEDFFDDFLIQFYDSAPIPEELIIPHEADPGLAEYLRQKGKRKVSIIVPQKGDNKELLNLVEHNIKTTFFAGSERVNELQKILSMEKLPLIIDCFDISHLTGTDTVASMVRFKDGFPDKSSYRKFKIRLARDGDDYIAMTEVVRRRYSGLLRKTMRNPDLIVIDGGLGQLGVATKVLKDLKLDIPIISLAKKFEEIYVPGKDHPLKIDRKNKGLQLLQAIRDEAHRFALTYQRLLRQKRVVKKQ